MLNILLRTILNKFQTYFWCKVEECYTRYTRFAKKTVNRGTTTLKSLCIQYQCHHHRRRRRHHHPPWPAFSSSCHDGSFWVWVFHFLLQLHLCSSQHDVAWCSAESTNICDNLVTNSSKKEEEKEKLLPCALKSQSSALPCGWTSCYTCCKRRQWGQSWDHGSAWSACPGAAFAGKFSHTGCRQMASPLCVYACALSCGVPVG